MGLLMPGGRGFRGSEVLMSGKTVKRLATLIAILALVGGSGYLIWRFQVAAMAQSVVAQAELAEKEGDFARAEGLYREHLAVVPDDMDIQVKYADAILKA